MLSFSRIVAILGAGLMFAGPSWAEDADPQDAGQELRMEEVLDQVESSRGQRPAPIRARNGGPLQISGMQVAGNSPVTSGTAFNPAISVILDTVFSRQFSGEGIDPAGFGGDHGHAHSHDHAHGEGGGHSHGIEEGFQVREVELVFSGSVDPNFDLLIQAVIFDGGVELEEGFVTTTSLPAGLQVKGGKFRSDIGYINRQHTHDWDFTDQPLVINSLFGGEGLTELGAQLSWVAPTQTYTRLGVEVLAGDNPGVSTQAEDGEALGLETNSEPRLFTAFAKFGPDLGYDHALLAGLSGGFSDVWQSVEEGTDEALDGSVWFVGADAVYKYDSGEPFGQGDWVLQGEYFYRERDLDFIENGNIARSGKFRQDGFYAQTLYGFMPRWNAGLRYEAVGLTNETFFDGLNEEAGTTSRYAGQISFLPTEFSRLRFQLSHTDPGDAPHGDHIDRHDSFWRADLQFTFSLGVHGAHDF